LRNSKQIVEISADFYSLYTFIIHNESISFLAQLNYSLESIKSTKA